MKLEDLFIGRQKKIIQGSGFVLLLAIFAEMIVGFTWFSRLSPYFKYAVGTGLKVYQMTACIGVFHLIALIYMIVDIVLFIPCKNKFSEKFNNTCRLIGNISGFLIITFIGVILSFAVSPNALNHGYSGKCYNYVFIDFMLGVYNHNELLSNFDFLTWYSDHYNKHVYGSSYYYVDSYYCDSIGMPTLVLAIIELILIIAFICGLCIAYKNPSDDDSMAENENENDVENNDQEEPKERSIKSINEPTKNEEEEPKKEEQAKKPPKEEFKDPSDSVSYDNEPDQAPGEKNIQKPEYNDDDES